MQVRWIRSVAATWLGAAVIAAALPAHAEKLPVFRLKPPKADKAKARDLLTRGFGVSAAEEKALPNAVSFTSGKKIVEIDKRSGLVFMGDMERLWNPRAKATVPDRTTAKANADRFLKEHSLLPTGDKHVRVAFSHHSETGVGADMKDQVDKQILDRQVNYRTEITVTNAAGAVRTIPVYGGGAKHKVSVGDQGRVIGYTGGWREIDTVETEEEILSKTGAEEEYRKRAGKAQIRSVQSRLAYYAAPAFETQSVLAPVWVISATLQIGNQTVPAREVVIPATKHGPFFTQGPPAKSRSGQEPPPPKNGDERPPQAGWRSVPHQFLDLLGPTAAYAQDSTFECGTSWIGPSQGLGGSPANKQGFVDQCRAAGWSVIFDWGELAAFESDWRRNDDLYVDAADLVFYTGHANQFGWVLNNPDDTFLDTSEANVGTIDLWGNTDVEWIIVAACGPHQSTHFVGNTTNAFDRWRGVFDGLHVFMGYGAVTNDNTSEGRRFMELSRAGWNVIDAWFRTAQEIQPSTNGYSAPDGPTVWVTAMYAHNGDHCARNDHLWGMGSTCSDVVGSTQQRYLLWSGT